MTNRCHDVKHCLSNTMLVLCMVVVCGMSFLTPPGSRQTFPSASLVSPVAPCPATVPGSSDPTGDEWPMFHGQLNHTGVATTTPVQGTGLTWSYTTGGELWSSPAVSGGRVYVGSGDNKIYCLDATTGTFIWSYTTRGIVDSSPAVAGGRVYVGSEDKNIYCLNATTGAKIWNYTTGWGVDSSPAIAGGHVYVGSNDYKIYCLDAITGKLNWSSNVSSQAIGYSSPAVAGGRVYVGSYDSQIYCLSAKNGTKIWNYTTGNCVDTSPAVASGRVYIGSEDNKLYCLNTTTGKAIWNYTAGWYVESSPVVVNGRVYTGGYDNNTCCLNATTGKSMWNYTTGSYIDSSPAVAGGCVYIGSEDNKTYCLNATTGSFVWSYTMNGYVWSSPAIAGGRVYVGTENHTLYCLPMNLGPAPPLSLQAFAGNSQISLKWLPPLASYGPKTCGLPALFYKIYRGTSTGKETYYMTAIDNQTSYKDWSVEPGRVYYYQVSAVSTMGEGSKSAEIIGNPFGVPAAPRGIQVSVSTGHVSLAWMVPKNNGGLPITNYTIYRGMVAGSEEYLSTVSNVTTYTDTNVTTGLTYYYTVSAVNGAGEGAQSTEASTSSNSPSDTARLAIDLAIVAIGLACVAIIVMLILIKNLKKKSPAR